MFTQPPSQHFEINLWRTRHTSVVLADSECCCTRGTRFQYLLLLCAVNMSGKTMLSSETTATGNNWTLVVANNRAWQRCKAGGLGGVTERNA